MYWPGKDDHRDYRNGEDSNAKRRDEIVQDVLERLRPPGKERDVWLREGRARLSTSPLMDITEYGRAVHAEMEALLSSARSGCSPVGGSLFSTTFPCHNCAKHIVGAGITEVVYVEPYPKSQALALFPDSIRLADQEDDETLGPKPKVVFRAFQGVGPRRFFDLFSMTLSSGTTLKRKSDVAAVDWTKQRANVRVPLLPNSYIDREVVATEELVALTTDETEASDEEEDRT